MCSEVMQAHKKVGWHHKTMEASIEIAISGARQTQEFTAKKSFGFNACQPPKPGPSAWRLDFEFSGDQMSICVIRSSETVVRVHEGSCTASLPYGKLAKDIPEGLVASTTGSDSGYPVHDVTDTILEGNESRDMEYIYIYI